MVTNNTVDMWKQVNKQDPDWFPEYFVSQPPHRDTLEPVYYKIMSPEGPIFWRNEGDDVSRRTTLYDLFMEDRNGFGVQKVDKEYTPWADSENDA